MWYSPDNFFNLELLENTPLASLFKGVTYVWELLDHLEPFIKLTLRENVAVLRQDGDMLKAPAAILEGEVYRSGITYELGDPAKGTMKVFHKGNHLAGAALIMAGAVLVGEDIEIGAGALVESGAMIKGPALIGPRSEVRQGAYIRGAVMSSPGAVIGHATEAKNTLLMREAKAGHFVYLGDSILGAGVNLGAGTKLANLKMNETPYVFKHEGQQFKVEHRKFGAIIGDYTETGCNTVTNPGLLLGCRCRVLPNSSVAPGYQPGRSFLGS